MQSVNSQAKVMNTNEGSYISLTGIKTSFFFFTHAFDAFSCSVVLLFMEGKGRVLSLFDVQPFRWQAQLHIRSHFGEPERSLMLKCHRSKIPCLEIESII